MFKTNACYISIFLLFFNKILIRNSVSAGNIKLGASSFSYTQSFIKKILRLQVKSILYMSSCASSSIQN